MATVKVPYFVVKPGKAGANRHFWQPAKKLRAAGWAPRRLSDDLGIALGQAQSLNEQLVAWRLGRTVDGVPAPVAQGAVNTVAWLIERYRASRFFTDLRPSTRRGYGQWLAWIKDWADDGAAPVRAIDKGRVEKLYLGLRAEGTPAKANAVIRVLRILLEHGVTEGAIASNPARKPRLIGLVPSGQLWPRDAVELFVEAADKLGRHSVGTAVLINEWLGQREGDILRLPRSVYRNGSVHVVQSKTGASVVLPLDLVPHLVERLEAERRRQDDRHAARVRAAELAGVTGAVVRASTLIVSEETGQPYTEDNFRHVFAKVRDKMAAKLPGFDVDYLVAGHDADGELAMRVQVPELQFMHLRHTAITRLAEAGVPPQQIAAITGHTLKSCIGILDQYQVRTGKLAREAFRRRLEHEGNGQ